MTENDTTTAPVAPAASGGECAVREGDELALVYQPEVRVTVTGVFTHHYGLFQCAVLTAEGERGLVRPWGLVPADGDTQQWQQQMRALLAAQRAHARDLITRRRDEVADRAEALVKELTDLARTLRHGQLPDPDTDPTESAARKLDDDLDDLCEMHAVLTRDDLIPADHPEHPDHEHEPRP